MKDQPVIVVVEVLEVRDADGLAAYRSAAREQMLARGGELLARGGSTFAGQPDFGPLAIQRWPSERAFTQWMESEEYQPLRQRRLNAADIRIAIVPCA